MTGHHNCAKDVVERSPNQCIGAARNSAVGEFSGYSAEAQAEVL